jgi:hypothetical protein
VKTGKMCDRIFDQNTYYLAVLHACALRAPRIFSLLNTQQIALRALPLAIPPANLYITASPVRFMLYNMFQEYLRKSQFWGKSAIQQKSVSQRKAERVN